MIPSFKEYFYPFMLCLFDGKIYKMFEIRDYIANYFSLTEADVLQKTKGGHFRHADRVSWTATYLKKLNLITLTKNVGYQITDEGKTLFNEHKNDFSLNTIRDLEGFLRLQQKEDTRGYWVPGHWTSTGRYVAGYVSQFEYRGRQRRFTKEELDEFQSNQLKKNKKK